MPRQYARFLADADAEPRMNSAPRENPLQCERAMDAGVMERRTRRDAREDLDQPRIGIARLASLDNRCA